LLAAATAAISLWQAQSAPGGERPVIAILPLTNLSGDQSKSYLGVGIADTLTNSLSQLSSITVISRTAMQESGAPNTTDLAKIAKALGVTMLVQGSFQQAGDRLRVHANLVTPDGRIVWSGDSESRFSDLFSLESRLAGALIDALRVTVTGAERERLDRPPTASRDALEAYWQGAALLEQSDTTQIDNAIDAFNRALAIDSQFSLAHANLGEAYRRKYLRTNESEWITRAVAAVSEALRLDPAQVDVRLSLAGVYRLTGRRGAAVEELRKALAQQPSNGEAHRQLGELLDAEGRPDEALVELRRAVAERPQYWRNYQSLGLFYYRRGNLPEAVAGLTRLVELRPDDANSYNLLGAALLASGDHEQARDNFERSIAVTPTPAAYSNLGTIHYSAKRYVEAVEANEQALRLAPNRAPVHRNLGDALLKLGRQAEARAAYEQAVALAQKAVEVNPSDAVAMSQLAVYEAKIGRRGDAERHANAAVAINPAGPEVLYRRAVVLALNGDTTRALEAATEAISRGYSKQLALDDDDLASLRPLPGFQTLMMAAP
jgi:tetratricopeptide (TPR) repeat protein